MSKSVLIVEDSPTEALRARLVLEREGYQVSLASDGKEGLVRAAEEKPDLIILDTIMPRMSGYEVYPRLRSNPETAHIPVLMLLTETEATEMPRRLGLGSDTYITKPYAPPLLLAGVGKATKSLPPAGGEVSEAGNGLQQAVQTASQSLGVGRVVLRDGYIVSVNPAAEMLFGLDADELAGKPFVEYIHDDRSSFTDMISRAESDGEGQGEFKVRVDGREEIRWWRIGAAPAAYEGQAVTQLACLDVTAWMRSEEEIERYSEELQRARQEAEAAKRAKTDFLANMSHELRTPLYGFMGTVDLVLDTELTPEQRDYLNTAKTSADALMAIVGDILEFSEIEAGQLSLEEKEFDLWATVEKTVEVMAPDVQEKGLQFSHHISPEVPRALVGDPRRLRQVLTMLIGNAVKFTERGEVAVRVEAPPLSPPHGRGGEGAGSVLSEAEGEVELHFLVRDTGIGIPEDKQEAVFEAFQQADDSATRQYGGIGLRLDVSRRLVGLMGGHVWVESEVGRGSTFHFTVVLKRQEGALRPPGQVARPAVEERKLELRVLLAEDSPTNQLIAVSNLKKAGHTVHVVDNGRKAVQALADREFDLVLMDVAMPEMDGLEATRIIREREKEAGGHIPIIAMTAFATKEYRKKCLEAGMDAYVTKPVSIDELHETIEALLRQADLGGSRKPPRSQPPVDLDAALEVVDGDVDLLQAVVEMSLEECPEQIESLSQALAQQDAPGVEAAAHRLKGVLGNVGGMAARDAAQRLETMAEEGNLDGGTTALEELKAELEHVMAFFSEPGWERRALGCDGE